MADSEIDIAALRLKLEQRDTLTSYEAEFLLRLLPACETRSGRKADPDLPVLHEAVAMLLALYTASGMTTKAMIDKIKERCGVSRSQFYVIRQQHPIELNIATEFLPGLIQMLERAVDVKSPYSYPVWDLARDAPVEEMRVRTRSILTAAAVLRLIKKIAETRATGWRDFIAAAHAEESK